jgi:hypothetical protein
MNNGASFATFLTEIASHGYLIIANGAPSGGGGGGGGGMPAKGGAPKGAAPPRPAAPPAAAPAGEKSDVSEANGITATGSTVTQLV